MSEVKVLSQIPAGGEAIIRTIRAKPKDRQRLQEMGLLPGTPVQLVRWAPMGDPVEIKVRGYCLSLRKHQAEQIEVDFPQ